MKNILGATTTIAFIVASVSATQAADAVASVYDWSGFYAGVNAGAAINNTDIENEFISNRQRVDVLQHNLTSDQTVFTGGGMLGYNHQIDRVVLGVEADFSYLGFSEDNSKRVVRTFEEFPGFEVRTKNDLSFEANWFGTIRGRLGYAFDNVLIYGTAGAAYGHLSAEQSYTACAINCLDLLDGSESVVNWGWTAGGGVEVGFDRWSLGAEYLFVDLGSADWETNEVDVIGSSGGANGNIDWQFSVVRATAKLHF